MTDLPLLRKDFTIRLETTKRLSSMVPKEKVFVSESGITKDADVKFLKECRAKIIRFIRKVREHEQ